MSEDNNPMELTEQELDVVAGGALLQKEGDTQQRDQFVFSTFSIRKGEINSTSSVNDEQFNADVAELIVTGDTAPPTLPS